MDSHESQGEIEMTHKYEYEVDTESKSAAAFIVQMVGTGKKVLELGTGPGSITKHLSNNQCIVTGVDIDDEALEIVDEFCEETLRVDLNNPEWDKQFENKGKYEAVVAGDVLEHLYDPWSTLPKMKSLISKQGYLVLSLPHVGHACVAAALMAEDFKYNSFGLLDQTHIRFFGLKNMQDLIEGAGLKIVQSNFCIYKPEETELVEYWNILSDNVKEALLDNPHATVYQVIVKVVPTEEEGEPLNLLDQIVEDSVPPERITNGYEGKGDIKLISFYLPQFHPFKENNEWWGKGFTEWTNVTKAKPLFEGHYQPHLPSDLGFYDLRVAETRRSQEEMALNYGVDAFCYHYYWFSGKRLMERPLEDKLNDPDSKMPFCICWANENWTRKWDAAENEILIAQEYKDNDDLEFIKSLMPYFCDDRYIKLNGAPFLIVYRPDHLVDSNKSIEVWRDYCRKNGKGFRDIHVCCALTRGNDDYEKFGFDSGVEFPPHLMRVQRQNQIIPFYEGYEGHLMLYDKVARSYINRNYVGDNIFNTVVPSWDNTARISSRAVVLMNGTPANYEYWLAETIRKTRARFPDEERFVFINAWNEWAEGCHLEPDQRYGHQFLEATLKAKNGTSQKTDFEDCLLPEWPKHLVQEDLIPPSHGVTDFLKKVHIERLDEITELKAAVASAESEIIQLTKLIGEYSSSLSWKVTEPIRKLSTETKKILKRK